MSASKELLFGTINIEEQKKNSPGSSQYVTTVHEISNGKKIATHDETGFIFFEYSGFAPKEIKTQAKTITFKSYQRDYITIPIIPEQKACVKFEQQINAYDDALSKNIESIFGKFAKAFTHVPSIKEPKPADDVDNIIDKPNKKPKIQYKKCKLRLEMGWNYYLDGQILDEQNSLIVKNAFFEAKKKKIDPNGVVLKLNLLDEDGNEVKREVLYGDVERVKDKILTRVLYRHPDSIPEDAKEVSNCKSKELLEYYGKGEPVQVCTPTDLDKYFRNNCYVRFVYEPLKVYAQRNKAADDNKRKCSYIFQIKLIDIINTRQHTNSSESNKQYENYVFRDDDEEEVSDDKADTESKRVSVEKDEIDGEEQEQSDGEEQEEELEETEETEEDEPVVETKPKGRGKVVVEQTKASSSTRKTK